MLKKTRRYNLVLCWLVLTFSLPIVFAGETGEFDPLRPESEIYRDWNYETYSKALNYFVSASRHWHERQNYENASVFLRKAAQASIYLSDYAGAESFLEKAIQLSAKRENSLNQSKNLSLLARVHYFLGDEKNGKRTAERALEVSKKTGDAAAISFAYFAYADFLYYENLDQMVNYYADALRLAGEAGDVRLETEILIEFTSVKIRVADPLKAKEFAKQAVENSLRLNDKRLEITALIGYGLACQELGEANQAIEALNRAEANFPPDLELFQHARLFASIGAIYQDYDELKLSGKYFQDAYLFYQKAKSPIGMLGSLISVFEISLAENKTTEFTQHFAEIKTLSQKLNNTFYLGFAYFLFGNKFLKDRDYQRAISHYEISIQYFRRNKYSEGLALAYKQLAQVYFESGDFTRADHYLDRALKIPERSDGKFFDAEIFFYKSQIEANLNQALDFAKASVDLTETLYAGVANSNLKRAYFSNAYDRYQRYIHLLMQKQKESPEKDFAVQALQASERSRSRSLLETLRLSEANFTRDANPELLVKEKEILYALNAKSDKLSDLIENKASRAEIEKTENEVHQTENELEKIKAELKRNSPIYSAIKDPPPFDVAAFQQNILDDRTVLLEFSLGEKESYLWLIGKNEVLSYVLPDRRTLEKRIDQILNSFERRQIGTDEDIGIYQSRISDLEADFNREAKQLVEDLLGQVKDKIKAKRLIIVPDGKLHYLPLSALPEVDSERPLIADHEVIYQPSASTLNLLTVLQNRNKLPNQDLLVLADPVFSDDDVRLTNRPADETQNKETLGPNLRDYRLVGTNGRIPRLIASQTEADSILNTIGKSHVTVVNSFEANRERVINSDLADYRVLHFATHGLVDLERPEVSSIVLSQYDETGRRREGFLRLQDIYALNLASELVVLSACQSGSGKEIKGEGLMSLNNAFMQAGAKSVLSSSWKVDDSATAELMKNFYGNLFDRGLPPADALRQAQLSMSQTTQYKSPFYWAAFTVQGEYRHPIPFNRGYSYYLLYVAGAIFLFGIWMVFGKLKYYWTAKK